MGKKSQKKKHKINKAHILQATQNFNQANPVVSPNTVVNQTTSIKADTPILGSAHHLTAREEDQFRHVVPDLKFFGLVTVLMVVILAVIYFWDASSGIILPAGGKIYDLLHLN
ncbi:MAG: hypothetical protein WC570_04075 [Patescibacteria group bacterium]